MTTSALATAGNLPTSNLSPAGVKPVVHNSELHLFYLKGDFFNTPAGQVAYTSSFDGVAAAPFGSRLYQIWAGNSGTYKKLWSGYLSGSTWGGRQQVDSGDYPLTSNAPDATEHNGKLYVVYNGSYDKTKIYYKALSGSYRWANEVELPVGSNQYYRPGAVSFNGQLFIFYTRSRGRVAERRRRRKR